MSFTLRFGLAEDHIAYAIRVLESYKQDFEHGLEQAVEILTNEGAEIAKTHYGNWKVRATPSTSGTHGIISVSGDMPLIAEFGAGDATLPVGFEYVPSIVRRGSYSEQHAQQYSRWGFWYFAGEPYTEAGGMHSLLEAKRYIIGNSTSVIREALGI